MKDVAKWTAGDFAQANIENKRALAQVAIQMESELAQVNNEQTITD